MDILHWSGVFNKFSNTLSSRLLLLLSYLLNSFGIVHFEIWLLDLSTVILPLEQKIVARCYMVMLVRVQTLDHIVPFVVESEACNWLRAWRVSLLLWLLEQHFQNDGVDGNLTQSNEDAAADLLVFNLSVPWMLSNLTDLVPLLRVSVENACQHILSVLAEKLRHFEFSSSNLLV